MATIGLIVTCAALCLISLISYLMGYYHGKIAACHKAIRKNRADFDGRQRNRDEIWKDTVQLLEDYALQEQTKLKNRIGKEPTRN